MPSPTPPKRDRQILVLLTLATLVLGIIAGVVWMGGNALSQFLPASPQPMTIVELEEHTGYDFPDGSEIISASSGQRALGPAGSWALLAKVRLPAGSSLPASSDPRSTISILETDSAGRIVVSVHTDNDDALR